MEMPVYLGFGSAGLFGDFPHTQLGAAAQGRCAKGWVRRHRRSADGVSFAMDHCTPDLLSPQQRATERILGAPGHHQRALR